MFVLSIPVRHSGGPLGLTLTLTLNGTGMGGRYGIIVFIVARSQSHLGRQPFRHLYDTSVPST